MNEEMVVYLVREAFFHVLVVAGPLLLVALVVGLVIAILQAATTVSEQTLTFVPKLVALMVVGVLTLPFMLGALKRYVLGLFQLIPTLR
ncbi:MAG: flagellar biosynthesis protein FliQ [Candidatus Kapabacteria bacterium]|nr:flagellar biosynthesis protein FliQ [Candidatus Kapabacteria bacterium]MCS7169636.1 flagellar biosynthesis protein FliQ [Candidatus Kapabacteria bacterium]MDW7996705.1 flagellar biosynthesis protein FliQ [Bacteroidota bacterium]MDW8224896.1 flagellar biosynthesis protein FliQ [Bacteroidota bacterium]